MELAKTTVFDKLKTLATKLGADAVIGVTLEYRELGKNGEILMLVATGTAVKTLTAELTPTSTKSTTKVNLNLTSSIFLDS